MLRALRQALPRGQQTALTAVSCDAIVENVHVAVVLRGKLAIAIRVKSVAMIAIVAVEPPRPENNIAVGVCHRRRANCRLHCSCAAACHRVCWALQNTPPAPYRYCYCYRAQVTCVSPRCCRCNCQRA